MAELRNAPRSAAKQQGKAIFGGREIGCTIRDISALGARLRFPNPTFLPRQFRLLFGDQDQKVTVIWQAGILAGVRFSLPMRHLPTQKRRTWPWSRR